MAYRNFTFPMLEKQFQIRQRSERIFTAPIPTVAPSEFLLYQLGLAKESALTTEKALSEAIVFPILQEIKVRNKGSIELFSGEILIADAKAGLNGETDFLLALAPGSIYLKSPIISVTEAKQGEIGLPKNMAQTCAQMLGARVFNQNNETPHPTIYGACTSGTEWLFVKLEGNFFSVDMEKYTVNNLPQLLGILQQVVDLQKA
jgi:hypothetical protein